MLLAVLLPFGVQLVHSFETHEHQCTAQNKVHFDSHEINCSVFHFKINNNTTAFSSADLKTVITYTEEKIISVEHQFSSEKPQHKSSRAPPYLLV